MVIGRVTGVNLDVTDRFIFMDGGNIVEEGSPEERFENPTKMIGQKNYEKF